MQSSRFDVVLPTLPKAPFSLTGLTGVRAAGVRAGIKASGNPDVALAVFDEAVACAGIFTQNKFAAAPVRLCQRHLTANGGRVRAIVVNSGNANACTGDGGERDALAMATRVAEGLGCPVEQVLVASTGVIGQPLPMDKVLGGIGAALSALTSADEGGRAFLEAIQTTDAFAKEAAEAASGWRVAGVCKGAGMIHPNMATMLAFVGTDARLTPEELAKHLPTVASQSFNAVHVDSHPSTNDSFFAFSTGKVLASGADVLPVFTRVARRLAWLIARDGEGASKVTTLRVRGATSDEAARAIADRIAASALVRTALYGNDPNWGRFVSQVGNAPEVRSVDGLRCVLQGITVFAQGGPTDFDRSAASKAMAREDVDLLVELQDGRGEAILMTSDLGYRYVEVNAEYTT